MNYVRPEVSTKNRYHIEKHRFYELKHFCLQYPMWKKAKAALSDISQRPESLALFGTNDKGSPTERCAIARLNYAEKIEKIEKAANQTDSILSKYLIKAVTEGLSYDILKVQTNVPCGRDKFYQLYRQFFWILDGMKD